MQRLQNSRETGRRFKMKFNTTVKVLLALMIMTGLAVTAMAEDDPSKEVKKEVQKETKKMSGKELTDRLAVICPDLKATSACCCVKEPEPLSVMQS